MTQTSRVRLTIYLLGIFSLMVLALAGYLLRDPLGEWLAPHLPLVAGVVAAAAVASGVFALQEFIAGWLDGRNWERRARRAVEGRALTRSVSKGARRRFDLFDWLTGPFFRTRLGRWLADAWRGGFPLPSPPYWYLALMALTSAALFAFGAVITTGPPIFGFILGLLAPALPITLVHNRAVDWRRRLNDQLPDILDALSNSIKAGYSLEQAIEFASRELAEPGHGAFGRVARQIELDHPLTGALQELAQEYPGEDLRLIVDGIILQKEVGGNLSAMLQEMAELIRSRVKLANDMRALSSQGRLSGWVIAALVPVSAAILMILNPRYADVLFITLPGQLALVAAAITFFAGTFAIFKILQVEV